MKGVNYKGTPFDDRETGYKEWNTWWESEGEDAFRPHH
jgi:hypothetical protein